MIWRLRGLATAAVFVATLSVSAAPAAFGATSAPLSPAVVKSAAAAVPQPLLPPVYLGHVRPTGSVTFSIAVAQTGRYRIQYFTGLPTSTSRLVTTVDGRRLPDVVVPADPGIFGVYASTVAFHLCAGTHRFVLGAPVLPFLADATLVDARQRVPGAARQA